MAITLLHYQKCSREIDIKCISHVNDNWSVGYIGLMPKVSLLSFPLIYCLIQIRFAWEIYQKRTMSEANNLAVQSLRRFLHIGGDSLSYNPWFFCNEPSIQQINLEKLADAIEQCAASGGEKALTEEFKKVFETGSSPHPICVIVALAKAMKTSEMKVRQEAYKLVHQVCRTSKELFMLMHCR